MKRFLLFRYLGGHYLANTIGAILGLAALVELLDMLDNATDVFDRGLGLSGLGTYLMLRLPSTFDQVITLGILIGGLVTFSQAARHNEIAAIRSAGVTVYRLALLLAPVVAIFAGLHFFIADTVAPQTSRALAVWWDATTPPPSEAEDNAKPKDKTIWFRMGKDIVAVKAIANGGRNITSVQIYKRDADRELTGRIEADSGTYTDDGWTLHNVTTTQIAQHAVHVAKAADWAWANGPDPADLVELANPASPISRGASRRALEGARARNRPASFYEMQIAASYAAIVASFVMLLLSLPAAFETPRYARGGRLVLRSMVLGLLFVLTNGVLQAFGSSGALPTGLAAWAGIGIFTLIGTNLLLRLEDN